MPLTPEEDLKQNGGVNNLKPGSPGSQTDFTFTSSREWHEIVADTTHVYGCIDETPADHEDDQAHYAVRVITTLQ